MDGQQMAALCTIRGGRCTDIRASTPALIGVSLMSPATVFVLSNMITFRAKLGPKLSFALDRLMVQQVSAWIGIFGFVIGTSPKHHSRNPLTDVIPPRHLLVVDHPLVVRESRRWLQTEHRA